MRAICNIWSSALKLFTNLLFLLQESFQQYSLKSQASPIFKRLVNFASSGTAITGHARLFNSSDSFASEKKSVKSTGIFYPIITA